MNCIRMKLRGVSTAQVDFPRLVTHVPIGMECLSKDLILHVLESGDTSYSFRWYATTALLLSSKQMAEVVTTWRLSVRTLDFLPKWERVFKHRGGRGGGLKDVKGGADAHDDELRNTRKIFERHFPYMDTNLLPVDDLKKLFFHYVWKTMITKFPNVLTLQIPKADMSDDELGNIVSLIPRLKVLDLGPMQRKLTKRAASIICAHLPKLTELTLRSIVIDDSFMEDLAMKYKDTIESLMLYSCWDLLIWV